jgi:hypothetical protein
MIMINQFGRVCQKWLTITSISTKDDISAKYHHSSSPSGDVIDKYAKGDFQTLQRINRLSLHGEEWNGMEANIMASNESNQSNSAGQPDLPPA